MTMTALERWVERMRQVLDLVDEQLEEKYGDQYPLHPARPVHGTTGSRSQDGLFHLGAAFTQGYTSKLGRGYVLEVRIATLSRVNPQFRKQIEDEAIASLREELPRHFPDQSLRVEEEDGTYKIIGDLGFGKKS